MLKRGIFMVGYEGNIAPDIVKKIFDQKVQKTSRKGTVTEVNIGKPLYMNRTFPNQISLQRVWDTFNWCRSPDNEHSYVYDNMPVRFPCCINDPNGMGTGWIRNDIYYYEDLNFPNASTRKKKKGHKWRSITDITKGGRLISANSSIDKSKFPTQIPPVPVFVWRKHISAGWRGPAGYPARKADKVGWSWRAHRARNPTKYHWQQGIIAHARWSGTHTDGIPGEYYCLGRALGLNEMDAWYATLAAYTLCSVGGVWDEWNEYLPNTRPGGVRRLKRWYVYYPNHPGARYVELGKHLWKNSQESIQSIRGDGVYAPGTMLSPNAPLTGKFGRVRKKMVGYTSLKEGAPTPPYSQEKYPRGDLIDP